MIEYGLPQAFLFEIDQKTAEITKQALTVSSFVGDIVTVSAPITVQDIGKNVVFHKTNENKYAFGIVKTTTTIELAEDSRSYFIANGVAIQVMAGMGIASYEDAEIAIDQSSIDYRGAYKFSRKNVVNDIGVSSTLSNVVFDQAFIEYINGMKSVSYGDGLGTDLQDFDVSNDKEVKPNNVAILIFKRRIEDNDKFEEFFLPRVRSASLSVPFSNDSFMVVDSYEFMCMPKSTGDGTVVQYRIEE